METVCSSMVFLSTIKRLFYPNINLKFRLDPLLGSSFLSANNISIPSPIRISSSYNHSFSPIMLPSQLYQFERFSVVFFGVLSISLRQFLQSFIWFDLLILPNSGERLRYNGRIFYTTRTGYLGSFSGVLGKNLVPLPSGLKEREEPWERRSGGGFWARKD